MFYAGGARGFVGPHPARGVSDSGGRQRRRLAIQFAAPSRRVGDALAARSHHRSVRCEPRIPRSGKLAVRPSGGLLSERRAQLRERAWIGRLVEKQETHKPCRIARTDADFVSRYLVHVATGVEIRLLAGGRKLRRSFQQSTAGRKCFGGLGIRGARRGDRSRILRAVGCRGIEDNNPGRRDQAFGSEAVVSVVVACSVPVRAISLIVVLIWSGSINIQRDEPLTGSAKDVLEAAIAIVREHALRRNEIDWVAIEERVRKYAAGSTKSADVYPAIRILLSELGDHHSRLLEPDELTAINRGRFGQFQSREPEVRQVAEGVGYVKMDSYLATEPRSMRQYAERLHQSFIVAREAATCGWIVDLRENMGGNMWAMLAGLKPFLGDAALGTFESPSGQSPPWQAGNHVGGSSPSVLARLESSWVAVLTGPRTASSGEAVAIAFRGRPHTRSFGLPTGGLSTANDAFTLPDGAVIALTTSIDVDRMGRRYGQRIDPEARIESNPSTGGDVTVDAAARWLLESSGCGERAG